MRWAIAIFLALAVLSGCTMWGEKHPPTWESATGIEAFERLLWQEIAAGRWQQVERKLAATFVASTPRGRLDREAAMNALRGLKLASVSVAEARIHPAGSDAVITYTLLLRGTLDGQPLPERFEAMTVWQQTGKDWIVIAHSLQPK